jgi:hypothetical protein
MYDPQMNYSPGRCYSGRLKLKGWWTPGPLDAGAAEHLRCWRRTSDRWWSPKDQQWKLNAWAWRAVAGALADQRLRSPIAPDCVCGVSTSVNHIDGCFRGALASRQAALTLFPTGQLSIRYWTLNFWAPNERLSCIGIGPAAQLYLGHLLS